MRKILIFGLALCTMMLIGCSEGVYVDDGSKDYNNMEKTQKDTSNAGKSKYKYDKIMEHPNLGQELSMMRNQIKMEHPELSEEEAKTAAVNALVEFHETGLRDLIDTQFPNLPQANKEALVKQEMDALFP